MAVKRSSNPVRFVGKVVETLEAGGKPALRIVLESVCIDLETDAIQGPHLGDKVIIEAAISIKGIQQCVNVEDPVFGDSD